MTNTTFAGENITVVENASAWDSTNWSGLSWSAVIAGALTALATTAIMVALGSGIGFSLASPFSSSPSGSTLTVIGAVWLVFSQGVGFATGGYIAGRLRTNPGRWHTGEVKFRDGANGLVVWAIGVVISMFLLAGAVGKITNAAGTAAATGGATAVAGAAAGASSPSMDYFSDTLLRTNPQAQTPASAGGAPATAPNGSAQANGSNSQAQRQQINRILLTALGPNGLSNDDRTYLAQIVSAQTGMSQDDAQKKVDDVVNRAKAEATQAADTARKAAEYFAFWTFMSLLFGAVCATLGGILGGDLRDEYSTQRAISTAPR